MNNIKFLLAIVLIFPFFLGFQQKTEHPSISNLMNEMFDKIDNISTLKYSFKNIERIDNELLSGEIKVTYKANPKKLYVLMKKPTQGAEVLYIEDENNNSAIYSPNGFPFIKLHLDPYGYMMRRNNHHTIHEAGMLYMSKILKTAYTKFPSNFKYVDEIVWKGRDCYVINIDISAYKIVNYTMKKGETIRNIAERLNLSDYKILELNDDIDEYDFSEVGKEIKIPSSYAKRMEMYIDKEYILPVFQKIFDEVGLFEQYEYFDIELNKAIDEKVFQESNLGLINE